MARTKPQMLYLDNDYRMDQETTDLYSGWTKRLFAFARLAVEGTPLLHDGECDPDLQQTFVRAFRDERGHRRAVDAPLLTHLLGGQEEVACDLSLENASVDLVLWHSLATRQVTPEAELFLEQVAKGDGSITPERVDEGVEIWTETELGCLHAASWFALDDSTLMERVRRAARWHTATLQPDNGTNHPWAIHVFVMMGGEDIEARLHADAMLHNACMGSSGGQMPGQPDRFSACVMLDSARWLERYLKGSA